MPFHREMEVRLRTKEGSVFREPAESSAFVDAMFVELRKHMPTEKFDTWFSDFKLLSLHDTEAEFAVPNGFVRDRLSREFSGILEQSITTVRGTPSKVRLTVAPANGTTRSNGLSQQPGNGLRKVVDGVMRDIEGATARDDSHAPLADGAPKSDFPAPYDDARLNVDYVFKQFVVGSCNKLAHAAAMAIGANPGRAYNPFFVHGSVGLGKTHLLQAICHAVRERNPDMRVVYLSCEEFTNRFLTACRERTLEAFRAHHRTADVLVVDDVEFLAEKGRTQDEFFHTFNALYNQKRQIVLSSDHPPAEIPTLQERLVSRFRWGFVTDMQPPDFDTRVHIVQRKAAMRSYELDDAVAQYIAERFDANIRELEGAIVKVIATAAITDREITVELAEEALQGLALNRSSQVSLDEILALITNQFPISARDIVGRSRTQMVSLPRQIGMHLARQMTEHSLEDIGRFFGNRDHTTVLYAVGKIKSRVQKDRMFSNLIQDLMNRLHHAPRPR